MEPSSGAVYTAFGTPPSWISEATSFARLSPSAARRVAIREISVLQSGSPASIETPAPQIRVMRCACACVVRSTSSLNSGLWANESAGCGTLRPPPLGLVEIAPGPLRPSKKRRQFTLSRAAPRVVLLLSHGVIWIHLGHFGTPSARWRSPADGLSVTWGCITPQRKRHITSRVIEP